MSRPRFDALTVTEPRTTPFPDALQGHELRPVCADRDEYPATHILHGIQR